MRHLWHTAFAVALLLTPIGNSTADEKDKPAIDEKADPEEAPSVWMRMKLKYSQSILGTTQE